MYYHEGAEEDAARDAFYEQISEELYPDHKDRAISDFTSDRLTSFYVTHPNVMQPAVGALQEGRLLLDLQRYAAAVVFFTSSIELLLKATLLQPVVYGLVHHPGLADIIMDHALGQTGFDRYQKLLANLFAELAGMDVKSISRHGSPKGLLVECTELQKLRNDIIHKGANCDADEAKRSLDVAVATYELIVREMLGALGLYVGEQGVIQGR
jgi:hypothetical protein